MGNGCGEIPKERRGFDELQPRGCMATVCALAGVVAFSFSDEIFLARGAAVSVGGGMNIKSRPTRR